MWETPETLEPNWGLLQLSWGPLELLGPIEGFGFWVTLQEGAIHIHVYVHTIAQYNPHMVYGPEPC